MVSRFSWSLMLTCLDDPFDPLARIPKRPTTGTRVGSPGVMSRTCSGSGKRFGRGLDGESALKF